MTTDSAANTEAADTEAQRVLDRVEAVESPDIPVAVNVASVDGTAVDYTDAGSPDAGVVDSATGEPVAVAEVTEPDHSPVVGGFDGETVVRP